MRLERSARAKINLFLHVGAPTADGYHPLRSLVTFAEVADRLVLDDAAPEGLAVTGAFATALTGGGNLVERAWTSIFEAAGKSPPPLRMALDKQLPVAAGIGGGSADAAATLKLLIECHDLRLPPAEMGALCLSLGADVPVCFHDRACVVSGRGEVISPPPLFDDLPAVLVNPGVALPTGQVFGRFDALSAGGDLEFPSAPEGAAAFVSWLAAQRNDLQPAAIAEAPIIGEVLAALEEAPETRLTRMSGSGATCFALCTDRGGADALAARLRAIQPAWWVVSTGLAGSA